MSNAWIPEIMYEENPDGTSSSIPFIMVPPNHEMPKVLYIFESRETGEFEPGLDGEPVPCIEWDLHQYADMNTLKTALDEENYDKVRLLLGLKPIREAAEAGKKITEKIRESL